MRRTAHTTAHTIVAGGVERSRENGLSMNRWIDRAVTNHRSKNPSLAKQHAEKESLYNCYRCCNNNTCSLGTMSSSVPEMSFNTAGTYRCVDMYCPRTAFQNPSNHTCASSHFWAPTTHHALSYTSNNSSIIIILIIEKQRAFRWWPLTWMITVPR